MSLGPVYLGEGSCFQQLSAAGLSPARPGFSCSRARCGEGWGGRPSLAPGACQCSVRGQWEQVGLAHWPPQNEPLNLKRCGRVGLGWVFDDNPDVMLQVIFSETLGGGERPIDMGFRSKPSNVSRGGAQWSLFRWEVPGPSWGLVRVVGRPPRLPARDLAGPVSHAVWCRGSYGLSAICLVLEYQTTLGEIRGRGTICTLEAVTCSDPWPAWREPRRCTPSPWLSSHLLPSL